MTVIGSVGEGGKSFEQGDWVTVTGQVTKTTQPDDIDITVTLFSHNEEYPCLVEPRRVEHVAQLPPYAQRCGSMLHVNDVTYTRCIVHAGHARIHTDGQREWTDKLTSGWIEDM